MMLRLLSTRPPPKQLCRTTVGTSNIITPSSCMNGMTCTITTRRSVNPSMVLNQTQKEHHNHNHYRSHYRSHYLQHATRMYNSKSNKLQMMAKIYYQDTPPTTNGEGTENDDTHTTTTNNQNDQTTISKNEQERIKAELSIHMGTDDYHNSMLQSLEDEMNVMDDMIVAFDQDENSANGGNDTTTTNTVDYNVSQAKNVIEQMEKVAMLYWELGMLDDAKSLQEDKLRRQMKLHWHLQKTHTQTNEDHDTNDDKDTHKKQKNMPPQHMDVAKTMHVIGSIQSRLNHPEDAKKWFMASLKMKERLLSQELDYAFHYQIGKTYNGLALIEIQMDEDENNIDTTSILKLFQQAEDHFMHHGEKRKSTLSNNEDAVDMEDVDDEYIGDSMADHPNVGSINVNMAMLYRKHGDFSMALQKYKEALRIQMLWISTDELESNGNKSIVDLKMDIGDCYKALEQYNKALKEYEEALRLHMIAIRKERQKQYQEKQRSEGESHPPRNEVLNPSDDYGDSIIQSPIEAVLRHNIGYIHAQNDRNQLAMEEYQSSLRIKKLIDPDHPEVALTLNGIGALKGSMGEYESALAYFNEALRIYRSHSVNTSFFGSGEEEEEDDENIIQTKKNIELVQMHKSRGGFGTRGGLR